MTCRSFLLALPLLLARQAALGQLPVPGYVITLGGDSLRGTVVVHSAEAQQKQVDFITAQGNQRQPLDARQLRAYGYTAARDTARYVAVRLPLGRTGTQPEAVFLRQLAAGPVELYQYHYSRNYYAQASRAFSEPSRAATPPTPAQVAHPPVARARYTPSPAATLAFPPLNPGSAQTGTGVALLLHRRGQPNFTEASNWNFSKEAPAFFAGCPALAPDLQAGRYRLKTLPQLVRRFNRCPAGQ